MHTCQIGWVVAHAPELLNAVIAAHIPTYMVGMSHHNLGYGGGPTASTDNGNLAYVEHNILIVILAK